MNELKPKISIGIPAFNAEETIEKIIKSILNQSIQDFEVIISDNASKDKTLQICRKYEKKDLRFKIFNQEMFIKKYSNYFKI